MNTVKYGLAGAAVLIAVGWAHGAPSAAPVVLPYEAECDIIDERTVEGFVRNRGPVLVEIRGVVRFSLIVNNSMSRPAAQIQAAVLVPPGRTMSVGRAQIAGSLLPSESCQLDVGEAIQ